MPHHAKRTKKIRRLRLALILLLVIVLLVGFWAFENFTFTVHRTTITSDKITTPLTLVHLSDLHGAVYGKNNRKLLRAVERQSPDLIFTTGDMYTYGDDEGREVALALYGELAKIAPVYAVPGEHDRNEADEAALTALGVTLLSYRQQTLTVKGNQLRLYGIDNVYYTDTFNLFYEFDKPPADSYNILLAHIPNFEAFNWFGPDLSLCGDTHGGLVQIPFLGPLYFDGEWLPEVTGGDKTVTDKGLFDTYTGHVYVTGGLGNYPYPLRLFNRPELSVLTLAPAED